MIIFITTDLIYVKHDYDIETINIDDEIFDDSDCVLVLHTNNYYFDLPFENINHDDLYYDNKFQNEIINIINNKSELILNYNLDYMIKYFDVFKNSFKILFKINPYLFLKNLKYACLSIEYENDKIIMNNYEYFENLILENAFEDDKYKLLYLFDQELIICNYMEYNNELLIEDIYDEKLKIEVDKYNKRKNINTKLYCIGIEGRIEFIETELNLESIIDSNKLIIFIEINQFGNMNFSENFYIYDCISYISTNDNLNIINYDLYKFIKNINYTITDNYDMIICMKTIFNYNKLLFKIKLDDIINNENNINDLSEERKLLINKMLEFK